jgi:uncharacterized membrane-anchored protein YhcB (DUF1043 family)
MTTLEIIFVSGSIGILIGMFIMKFDRRSLIRDLEADKEILLDFHDKLIADREEMDQRYLRETKAYINHLDTHVCRFVGKEEEWPEEITFQ